MFSILNLWVFLAEKRNAEKNAFRLRSFEAGLKGLFAM